MGKWLRGAARNLVHRWWRQKQKLPQDVADRLRDLAAQADDPLSAAAAGELRDALERCLGRLAAPDRDLLARRYEAGTKVAVIAEQLGRNAATVRVRLFRIRQRLKACLEAQLSGEAIP